MDRIRKNHRTRKRRQRYAAVCICLTAMLLSSCAQAPADPSGTTSFPDADGSAQRTERPTPSLIETPSPSATVPSISAIPDPEQRIRQKRAGMSLSDKVAQLFVIPPEALTGNGPVTEVDSLFADALDSCPVGGLFYSRANLVSPQQLTRLTGDMQEYAEAVEGMPLFLAIDEEGGAVARIAENSAFSVDACPSMLSVGATGDMENAYGIGDTIGGYLSAYGINLDLAPVADVLTHPGNTVIGNRSFGSGEDLVSGMALAVARGLADNQVFSCFKHFPGHGSTAGDSHYGFAYTNKTLDELMARELVPFQAAVDNRIPFIMVSHISVPEVTGDNTPASLSKVMVTDILRNRMGYDGIVITDSMGMGAIVNTYGVEEAAVLSIRAGVDMILKPANFQEAYLGVLEAVADGTLTERRIDESVDRILRVKLTMENG